MIRVLWTLPKATAWTGGLNYFRNLASALMNLSERTVEPVLSGSRENLPEPLCNLPSIPKYSAQPASPWHPCNIRSRLERLALGRDWDYDRFLRRHRIDLQSHLVIPAGQTDVPFLTWIPDFQHRHLPNYFTSEDIEKRNCHQAQLAKLSQGVLLSSEDARQDFNRFYPGNEAKTHVLRFVAIPPAPSELPPAEKVLEKYGINQPFFHVPNQVWAHKNHEIILNALRLFRERGGRCPLVISTGQTEDYRDANYFKQLIERVREAGVSDSYRFLGLIDYKDACVIMRNALALINPSLFEGWSTTVEEAKSIGKRMLLSSLPVHREQAHDRSSFFDPYNAEQLALLMEEVIDSYLPAEDINAMHAASKVLPKRIQEVGMAYEAIIRKVLGKSHI